MATMDGWNDFITAISGGLLYGRDVPRPKDICPIEQPRHRQKKRRQARNRIELGPVCDTSTTAFG
jgi:hypothetical protein